MSPQNIGLNLPVAASAVGFVIIFQWAAVGCGCHEVHTQVFEQNAAASELRGIFLCTGICPECVVSTRCLDLFVSWQRPATHVSNPVRRTSFVAEGSAKNWQPTSSRHILHVRYVSGEFSKRNSCCLPTIATHSPSESCFWPPMLQQTLCHGPSVCSRAGWGRWQLRWRIVAAKSVVQDLHGDNPSYQGHDLIKKIASDNPSQSYL